MTGFHVDSERNPLAPIEVRHVTLRNSSRVAAIHDLTVGIGRALMDGRSAPRVLGGRP